MIDRDHIYLYLVQMGSERALRNIMRRYSDMVYRLCVRMLCDKGAADEAAQEVFLRVWRNASSFNGKVRLSTWIYRIAYNICVDMLRMDRGYCREEDAGIPASESSSPDYNLSREDDMKLIYSALSRLTVTQRTVFVMKEIEGMDYREIEEVTGIGYNSLKTNYSQARKNLRQWITRK